MVIARTQASPNMLGAIERLSLIGSVAGSFASMLTQQVSYAFAPLSFSLVIALVNRQRLEQLAQQSRVPIITQTDLELWREVKFLRGQVQALPPQIEAVRSTTEQLEQLVHLVEAERGYYQPEQVSEEQFEALETVVENLKLKWQIVRSLTLEVGELKQKQMILEKGRLQPMQQQLDQMQQEAKALETKIEVLDSNFQAVAPMPLKLETLEQRLNSLEYASAKLSEVPLQPTKLSITALNWLTDRNIKIKSSHQPDATDRISNQFATVLGNNYKNLSRFYDAIKRNSSTGNSFTLKFPVDSREEIAACTSFGKSLHDQAFLANYHYSKNTKTIYATPHKSGQAVNFLTGAWLERFVYLKVSTLLLQNQLKYSCVANAQISFPNGEGSELDLFFVMENKPLWIECKTGNYQAHIAKYSEAKKMLSVPKERAFLVVLDLADHLLDNLTNFYDITIMNQQTFLDQIQVSLGLSN